jgi:hypothetical protein
VHKKVFRMSWPVAGIGFLFLIPAALGVIISALMLFGVLSSAAPDITRVMDEAVSRMRAVYVPQSVIAVLVKVTSGALVLFGGGFPIALGVASFIAGLLGWLFVKKKRVRQCPICRATVEAS